MALDFSEYEVRTLPQLHTQYQVLLEHLQQMQPQLENSVASDETLIWQSKYNIVETLLRKARSSAILFQAKLNKEWLLKYLEGSLEIDCLGEIYNYCRRTGDSFSHSHIIWLRTLQEEKVFWSWHNEETKKIKLQALWSEFETLQKLATIHTTKMMIHIIM